MSAQPKHYFALFELVDSNKEYIYLAFSGNYESYTEFINKTFEILEYDPNSINDNTRTKHGKLNSITSRKIKPQSPNAHVHFCTGRYGLVGFGRHVVFDQTIALQKYETDSRPHTLRTVKLMFI